MYTLLFKVYKQMSVPRLDAYECLIDLKFGTYDHEDIIIRYTLDKKKLLRKVNIHDLHLFTE